MKFEIKIKGTDILLVLEDSLDKDFYDAELVYKRKKGADVKIGRINKQDLKRIAKAS